VSAAAWALAVRIVTVKETRSGSIPADLGGFGLQRAKGLVLDAGADRQLIGELFGVDYPLRGCVVFDAPNRAVTSGASVSRR
jgi:hypothetical protein